MRRLLKLIVLGGIVAAVVSALRKRASAPAPAPWPASTSAPRAVPDPVPAPTPAPAWVEPGPSGTCPDGYPVKAKTASGIFHVEGGASYARTTPDRCYRSVEAAEADSLRPAKR